MRKTLLIISLVAAMAMGANAQTGNLRFGIKVGPTLDWVSSGSTAATNEGFRLGANLGLVCDYYVTSYFAVSSGVDVNILNMKYTFTDRRFVEDFLEETNVAVSRRLNAVNVEIPVKVKLSFDVADLFKAYAEAGLGLGFNCRDASKDSYSFYWVNYEGGDNYVDCTNQYRPLQLSMLFGLGAEYEISRDISAFAQLTFDHAFSNAFVRSLEKQTGSIIRNNYVGVVVGIMH